MRGLLTAIGVMGALAACNQQPGTILENVTIGEKVDGLATGARTRLISSKKIGVASRPGRVDPSRILCVEPSPDVALAVASQVSAGLAVLGKGSGSLSTSTSEGIAQLAERTTTLQMILTQGYHACLDYSNGAVTATTYSMRQSRLDDLIATLVLSENATAAFGRSGAAIATGARGSAQAAITGIGTASEDVDRLREELRTTEAKIAEQEKEIAKTEADIAAAKEKEPPDDTKTLEADLKAQNSNLEGLEATRAATLRELKTSADTVSKAASDVRNATGVGGLTRIANAEVAKVVGEMQSEFINVNPDQRFVSVCLTELGLWSIPDDTIDGRFRQHVLRQITGDGTTDQEGGKSKKQGQSISADDLNNFFLGRQLSNETLLSEFCTRNLEPFLRTSVQNRHSLELARLELETKRLDLRGQELTATLTSTSIDHPIRPYNLLIREKPKLDGQLVRLTNEPIPAVGDNVTHELNDSLTASKGTLTDDISGALAQAVVLIGDKTSVDKIEREFTDLIGDTRRSSTGTDNEIWQGEFRILRAKANDKSEELRNLTKELSVLGGRSDRLVAQIKAAK